MRSLSVVATLIVAAVLGGCPDNKPVDTDGTPTSDELTSVVPGIKKKDTIQAGVDNADWMKLRPGKTGKATVVVDFGDDNKVTGQIGVYQIGGKDNVVQKDVTPDGTKFKLEWDVKEDDVLLVMIKATKGKGAYQIELSVAEPQPVDPCTGVECDDGKECKNGECILAVDKNQCNPKCPSSKVCKAGACVAPCGGGCGSGMLCLRSKDECVKDPCAGKTCPTGQKCYSGTCKDIPKPECKPACAAPATCNLKTLKCETPPPPTCSPACADGQVCNAATQKCEAGPPPSCSGPLSGSIVNLLPGVGAKTTLVINKGTKQCVAKGMTGRISGVTGVFKVTEVYEFRCKAEIAVEDKVIGANRGVTIDRP